MLEGILARTRTEIEARKSRIDSSLFKLDGETRSLKVALSGKGNAIIAEIKPSSPSMGRLRAVDVPAVARQMENGGARALSVLTEPFYFHGSLENMRKAKDACSLPVMRKDFIIDEYQLLEAKHYGADAVLLMVSALGDEVKGFYKKARGLGMEALVEVHDEDELDIALSSGAEIIGINNRNLKDLSVDLNTSKILSKKVPPGKIIVSESGVKSRSDLDFVLKYADAALIGSSLMLSPNIEAALRGLVK
jgi:indole-3-glycerol phosphate synthase